MERHYSWLSHAEYLNDYVIPYSNAINGYLSTLEDLSNPDSEKDYSKQIAVMADLAAIAKFSMMQPESGIGDFSYTQCLAEYMVDNDINDLFKAANKTMSITETALDSYIAINSIQAQREAIVDPITRLSIQISDNDSMEDMQASLENFACSCSVICLMYRTCPLLPIP